MNNNNSNLEKNQELSKIFSHKGFSSIADDYVEIPLDLNRKLVKNPLSTYFLKIKGDSLNQFGIFNNDIVITDKNLTPKNNNLVIAEINGELVLRKFEIKNNQIYLSEYNKKHLHKIDNDNEFAIWGVVTATIHEF